MLDIIQRCVGSGKGEGGAGLRLSRIDGSHSDLERQRTIAAFNRSEDVRVCLVRFVGVAGTAVVIVLLLYDAACAQRVCGPRR